MSVVNFKQVGYRYGEDLQLLESSFDLSVLKENEILVKVGAAALNPVDLILHNTHRPFNFFNKAVIGFGRDFSGTVEAVGSAVTKFERGDKVSGLYEETFKDIGTVSEYLVVDTVKNVNLGLIPTSLSLSQAAAFPLTFGTAYTALTHFKSPKECDNVLVIGGATAVGAFVVQLLKKVHGVKTVVSVNSSKSAERVKRYGADIIIDYTKSSVKSQGLSLAKDVGKFDLIVDCVGNSDFFDCMDDVLKPKAEGSGYVSINGSSVGDYNKTVFQNYLTWANFKLLFFPRSWAFKWSVIEKGTWYEYAKGLIEEGTIEIPVDSVHKLTDFQEAITTLKDHKAQGKVVIEME